MSMRRLATLIAVLASLVLAAPARPRHRLEIHWR